MRIAITGADRPLGAALCRGLSREHAIVSVGTDESPGCHPGDAGEYRRSDLRIPSCAQAALRGADAVVHAQPHDPPLGRGPDAEQELLDLVARGTYVLVGAACDAGIGRLVLVSQIGLMDEYPPDHVVGPHWRPNPGPDGQALAPYLAELVCREIARTGRIEVPCLRLGALDDPEGTSARDAVRAVEEALRADLRGYHWQPGHVVSGGRFAADERR